MHQLLAVVFAAAVAPSSPAATASPSASPAAVAPITLPAAVTARAKDWFHRLQTGNIDRTQLTAAVASNFSQKVVLETEASLAPLGDPVSFEAVERQKIAGNTAYIYKVTFQNESVDFVFSLDDTSGKISGLQVTAAE